MDNLKYCKHCGGQIPSDAVICTLCGRQVEKLDDGRGGIVINNVANASSSSSSDSGYQIGRRLVSKWVAFFLCILGGFLGLHKFYEGKIGMGLVYACTGGLFFVGFIIDALNILGKPDPYEVL